MNIVDKIDSDALRLQSLGYKQELVRTFTRLTNYGMTLSVVSISSGITSIFAYGSVTGGPVLMIYGWLIVGLFTLFVTLSMAEIYSMLVASVIFVGLYSQWSPQPFHIILIDLGLIITHGICNSLGPRFLNWITHVSTSWQLLAPIIVTFALLLGVKEFHQSASFVFTTFKNETGWSNTTYVVLIGLLQAQFCLSGYDASAHMTEETKKADVASSWGMVSAVVVSAIVGWLVLVAFFLAIHDYNATVKTATGFPVTQILLDNFGQELTIFFMCLLLVACWFCGLASVTTNSRMIYAFSCDKAIPGSLWWHTIHPHVSCPLYAVWLSCFVAFLLARRYLGNSTAYSAIAGLSTICLYISCVLPILCKLIYPKTFVHGPFHLGRFSIPVNIISVLWFSFIVVLFVLPCVYPVTAKTMNYASVGVGALIIFAGLGYILSARYWFHGPIANVDSNKSNKDNSTFLVQCIA